MNKREFVASPIITELESSWQRHGGDDVLDQVSVTQRLTSVEVDTSLNYELLKRTCL